MCDLFVDQTIVRLQKPVNLMSNLSFCEVKIEFVKILLNVFIFDTEDTQSF